MRLKESDVTCMPSFVCWIAYISDVACGSFCPKVTEKHKSTSPGSIPVKNW